MEPLLIIIISVFGIILLSVLVVCILRFLKGKIVLKLNKTSFYLGDEVVGSFDLCLKKSVNVNRLYSYIKAESITKTYNNGFGNSGRGRSNTYREEVFRFEKDYQVSQNLPSHYKNTFDISLSIPDKNPVLNTRQNNNMNMGGNVVGNLLSMSRGLNVGSNSRVEFSVGVILDCDGVDLTTLKKIFVDVSQKDPQTTNNNTENSINNSTQNASNQNQTNQANPFNSINSK